jgi:hypothetical protein
MLKVYEKIIEVLKGNFKDIRSIEEELGKNYRFKVVENEVLKKAMDSGDFTIINSSPLSLEDIITKRIELYDGNKQVGSLIYPHHGKISYMVEEGYAELKEYLFEVTKAVEGYFESIQKRLSLLGGSKIE